MLEFLPSCDFVAWMVLGVVRTLDLGLDIVDGVRGLNLEGDGLTREGLDEDLHLDEGLRCG
jgi:hypothetical protein